MLEAGWIKEVGGQKVLAEKVVWVGESSGTYDKKAKSWSQYLLWPFKLIGDDTTYLMNEEKYHVYLREKELLDFINSFPITKVLRKALIETIEKYGDSREEKGRQDVQDDWAESEAGEGA